MSSDVSPSNLCSFISRISEFIPTQNQCLWFRKKRKQFSSFACATGFKCFWLATNLKVLQLKMEMCSSRNMAVRGLRCEFKGFCGDAALPHCCDRRAFLLAFIFSRRFTRWLLVISISSTLSKAVRSCGEQREITQSTFCHIRFVLWAKSDLGVVTSLWSLRFSALSSSSIFSALSAAALYRETCPSSLLIWGRKKTKTKPGTD